VQWLYRLVRHFFGCAGHGHACLATFFRAALLCAVIFYHPDAIKEIFSLGPDHAQAGKVNSFIGPLLGRRSLLMLDGAEHLRHRKLLLPPLHGERMARYGDRMVRSTEETIATWPDSGQFPIHPHLQRIALDVILRVIFGVEAGQGRRRMHSSVSYLLEVGASPLLLLSFFTAGLTYGPTHCVSIPNVSCRAGAKTSIRALILRSVSRNPHV